MIDDGRVPPYNVEAEVSVLGSVLLNNDCWSTVFANLNDEDFYVDANRRVFNSMYGLFEAGVPVDHVTLGNRLREAGDLEKIGGAIALHNITDAVATTANIEAYVGIVKDDSSIRSVIHQAQNVVASGMSGSGTSDVYSDVERLLHAARDLTRGRMPDSLMGLGEKVLDNYRKVADGYRGIELPWPTIDLMTAGAWPKTVTIFVGRPGVGKSQIAVLCARHAWRNNKRVLIVSPEMSKVEIAERFFVVESGVSYHGVVSGQLPTIMETELIKVICELKEKHGIWILDSDDDLTPAGIEAAIRACDPELVAIDSIYDLRMKGERRDRALGAIEWMKRSCKEYGFASIGFAQQNRAAELSEKKGGGARLGTIALADEIAQDAHAVFALEQTKDDKADKVMKLKPLKLRRGQFKKPTVKVHWDFETMNFDEIEDDDEYENGGDIPF